MEKRIIEFNNLNKSFVIQENCFKLLGKLEAILITGNAIENQQNYRKINNKLKIYILFNLILKVNNSFVLL